MTRFINTSDYTRINAVLNLFSATAMSVQNFWTHLIYAHDNHCGLVVEGRSARCLLFVWHWVNPTRIAQNQPASLRYLGSGVVHLYTDGGGEVNYSGATNWAEFKKVWLQQ